MNDIKVGIKLTADGKAAVISLDQVAAALERTGTASKRLQGDADRLSAAWAKLSAQGSARLAAIENAKRLTEGLSAAGRTADEARAQAERLRRGIGILNSGFDAGTTSLAGYAKGLAGVYVAYQAVQRTAALVAERVNVAAQVDRQRAAMEAASNGMLDAANNMRFVEGVAQRLGVNLMAATEGFVGLNASAKGTELQGQKVRDIFESVTRSAAALGKGAEDVQGILNALGQMISKDVIQMEELRGQLGDRLPGAFQVAARSMGLTTAALDKLISSGQVTAAEFLPKLAQALDETYGNARFDRISNNIARLDNAWTKLKANLVDTQTMSTAIGTLAGLFDKLNAIVEKSKGFGDSFNVLPSKSAVGLALGRAPAGGNLDSASKALETYATQAELASQSLAKLSKEQVILYSTAIKYQIDPALMLGLAQRESSFNPNAINEKDGGRGLGQFMPKTWAQYQQQAGRSGGFDAAFDPVQNADNMARFLKDLAKAFKGDVAAMVSAYNAGESAVQKAIARGRDPGSVATAGHTSTVLGNMADWKDKLKELVLKPGDLLDPKVLKHEQDSYYQFIQQSLTGRAQLEDAAGRTRLTQQQTELSKLKQAAEAAAKDSDIQIKTVIDTQGLDAARQAIDQAEVQQAEFLRRMNTLAGGKDNAAVAAAERQVQAMDTMIAKARELGQWDEQGAKLTQERALAEEQLKQARIEAGGQTLALEQALADNHAKYQALRESANQDDLAYQRQAADYRQQLLAAEAEGRKAAIDGAVEQLKTESAVAEAQRAQQAEQLSGLAAVQAARANIQATLKEQLAIAEAEKTAALDKLAIDYQTLESQAALLTAQQATTTSRADLLAIEEKLAAVRASQDENLRAQLDAMNALTAQQAKLKTDAAAKVQVLDVQQVKEAQLEMNAFWDQLIGRVREYSAIWNQASGDTVDSFGKMLEVSDRYLKNQAQIAQAYEQQRQAAIAAAKANGQDEASTQLVDLAEGAALATNTLMAVADAMYTIRDAFAKGSGEYQTFQTIAAAAAAAAKATAIAEGILAIVHQASSGDPYTAIPRMIAMAAQLATLGIQTSMGGGGATLSAAGKQRQETAGTGSVLGDSTAKSESIANSLAIIRDNSSNDLNYSAKMLRALENIEAALSGAAASIFTTVQPLLDQALPNMGLGKTPISLFSGFDKELSDWGLIVLPQKLGDILSRGLNDVVGYVDITKTFSALGQEISSSTESFYAHVGDEVTRQFGKVIFGIRDVLIAGGEAFGLSAADFNQRLQNFVVDLGNMSFMDMTGDQVQEQLAAIFSKLSDDMARALMPGLGKFRQVGEGYAETFLRVAEGINRAKGELEQLGMTAIDFKDISRKQGDVAAEMVRQTLAAQGNLSFGLKNYANELSGSAEEIISAYKKLKAAQNLFATAGFDPTYLDRTMINAAGGLDAFVTAMERYNEAFLTAGERLNGQIGAVSEEFMRLGVTMPTTMDGFRTLMEGLDTTTESGKKLFGALMQVSDGFINMQQELDKLRDKYSKYLGGPDQNANLIKGVVDDFNALIKDVVANTKTKLIENGDPEMQRLLGNRATYQKDYELNAIKLDRLTTEKQEVEKTIARLNAKKKLTKAEKEELANATTRLIYLDRQIPLVESWQAGAKRAVEAANAAIDEYAKTKSGDELASLIKAEGDALLGTLGDIWDKLSANLQAARETFAKIGDTIAQLKGEAAGPQGVIDYKSAKAAAAVSAALNYSGADAGTLNTLYTEAYQAVMDEYNARLEQLNAEKSKYEAIKQAAEQALQTLDATAKGLQSLRNTIAQNLDELAKAGSGNSTEYEVRKYGEAKKAIQDYFAALNAGGQRNVETELQLLEDARQAVMDRYQAEVDAIMRANQAQVDALTTERDERQKAHDEQIKGLEEQKRAAEELYNAVERVRDYAQGLKLGQHSDLSPERKLAEAQRQFQELQAKAAGGDAKAMADLTGASDAYLQAAKDYYGSGSQYSNILDGVQQAMNSLGAMNVADPNSIQARIDELNAAHEVYLKSIDERIKALTDPEQNEAIKALREKAAADLAVLNGFAEKTQNEVTRQREIAEKELADANARLAPIDANIATLKTDTANVLQQLADKMGPAIDGAAVEAQKQMKDLIEQVKATNILNADQLQVLDQMAKSMGLTGANTIPAHARGGQAQAGLALVGEKGPELIRFERPAQVLSAEDTRKALAGQDSAELKQAMTEFRREMQALVTIQSRANPEIIAELRETRARIDQIERTQRLKS